MGAVGGAEHQSARGAQPTIGVEHAQSTEQFSRTLPPDIGTVRARSPLLGPGRQVAPGGDQCPGGYIQLATLRGYGHLVVARVTLPVQPPFGAVYRGAVAARTPPDASADVLYRFAGLRDVEHQEAYSLDNVFFYGRRDTYILVHAVAKPVRVQGRAKQPTAAIFNSNDDCATARSVRHTGDFVG